MSFPYPHLVKHIIGEFGVGPTSGLLTYEEYVRSLRVDIISRVRLIPQSHSFYFIRHRSRCLPAGWDYRQPLLPIGRTYYSPPCRRVP